MTSFKLKNIISFGWKDNQIQNVATKVLYTLVFLILYIKNSTHNYTNNYNKG